MKSYLTRRKKTCKANMKKLYKEEKYREYVFFKHTVHEDA